MNKKSFSAFTLIEILITISIISIAMIGISTLTGNQVTKLREKVLKEDFVNTYNAVLLNAIGSSNVDGQWAKNKLVIYDGKVATAGFESKPIGDAWYTIVRNGLPWSATVEFDNYSLWCSINWQRWEIITFELQSDTSNEPNVAGPTIGCFEIDLGTCKLLEKPC